jgi:hypothetical protein
MTVRVYSSSDASAPVLRGNTPGDLINLLDKCLVTGYGSKTAAGWTKPYTGTNVAAFRQGAGSNSMYLRVDDTSTAATNRSAKVVGYETMTDVNTGSPSAFPTAAQKSGGLSWYTHASSGSVANPRPWVLIADEMFFWLLVSTYPERTNDTWYNELYAFGDILPYKSGDTTHTVILGPVSDTSPNSSESNPLSGQAISSAFSGGRYGLFVARSFTNFGGPLAVGWHADAVKANNSSWGSGYLSYPHGPDGGLYLSPVWVHEPQASPYAVRGIIPGLWVPCHDAGNLTNGNTFNGQGELLGKTFYVRKHYLNGVCMEISDTWGR